MEEPRTIRGIAIYGLKRGKAMTEATGALVGRKFENDPNGTPEESTLLKRGLAQMLKGGVIMDVVMPDQARIDEDAGACAVMALERVPADIRKQGGVARMSDPDMIESIMQAVSIPGMAKRRI